jgi:hypothetical protein
VLSETKENKKNRSPDFVRMSNKILKSHIQSYYTGSIVNFGLCNWLMDQTLTNVDWHGPVRSKRKPRVCVSVCVYAPGSGVPICAPTTQPTNHCLVRMSMPWLTRLVGMEKKEERERERGVREKRTKEE